MKSLRFPGQSWRGRVLFLAGTLVLSGALIAAPPKTSRSSSGSRNAAAAKPAAAKKALPAGETAAETADAYPSARPASPDLLLPREVERQVEALSAFAAAVIAEDNAESDKALEGYRRALERDPGYAELAVKVAFELARRNDISGGIQVLKDAIKASPREPMPYVFLSQLYSKLKKPDLALKYAEQSVKVAPDELATHAAVLEVHTAAGQPQKAEETLDRAAKSNSVDAKFWLQLGELYGQLYGLKTDRQPTTEEVQKMTAVYRKAAEHAKRDAVVQARVGDFFILSRQLKECVPYFQAALQLPWNGDDTARHDLRDKLARAYLALDQEDEAIAQLEAIVKEQPRRFETYELLGELHEKKGDSEKAIGYFQKSLMLDSSDPQNYLRFAMMLGRQKKYEKAIEVLKEARSKFSNRPEITIYLAMFLSQAKRHTDALTMFAEAKSEIENTVDAELTAQFFFQYGAAAEQAGMLDKAAEMLRRSIESNPDEAAQAYNYLGYMWVDRGMNLDEAGQMIQKALELDRDNGAFLDSLGWYYHKKGDHERALKELLRAADQLKAQAGLQGESGEDPVVYDHIGDTYHALGKVTEAVSYWQKALQSDDDGGADKKKISEKIEAAKQKLTKGEPTP